MTLFGIGFCIFPVCISVSMWWWAGRMGVEKAVTQFAQPDGLFWCLLTGACMLSWRQSRSCVSLWTLLWLFFTLSANPILVARMCAAVESDYLQTNPHTAAAFDAVVVLGGSTKFAPNGTSQLACSGDRVMLGARLYLSGKTKRLICSGESIKGLSNPQEPNAAQQTLAIWADLQIPREAITIIRGRNTSEELQQVRKLVDGRLGRDRIERIGLVTSAWHLPRAMRLAKAQQLTVTGLPADFLSDKPFFSPLRFIPSATSLDRLARITKEWLAQAVGR